MHWAKRRRVKVLKRKQDQPINSGDKYASLLAVADNGGNGEHRGSGGEPCRGAGAEEIRSRRDTEIKIGNIMPYSGPASAYGEFGKTEAAYFRKINAEGGVNGRKINFVSYYDAYSPPKAVEQARKLVENDEVLLILIRWGRRATPRSKDI
jgi:ABC-type branched-subunit amino acid transport system substrate-binding protein